MLNTAISRRQFSQTILGSLVTYSLLESIAPCLGDEVKPIMVNWLRDINSLGKEVQGRTITQQDWQQKIEALFRRVELTELLRFIDFEKLTKQLALPEIGARSLQFKFPKVEGVPTDLVFGKQIFAMKKGRSVVPHGHHNMATAFLVLGGNFHGRHYDRLEDQADHYLIKPTIDHKFAAGETSSISEFKDNIHWFVAESELAYLFNIHVYGVLPKSTEPSGRLYLDPLGEKLAGGVIKAPKLDYTTAHKKFG